MCNLYQMTSNPDAMRRLFDVAELPNFPPSYRIAPTDPAPIVRLAKPVDGVTPEASPGATPGAASGRELVLARWSLVPHWSKTATLRYTTFNARGEELADKPLFREAFHRRRCLVPADGFYERLPLPDGGKQYYRVALKEDGPFAFAGLWELWRSPDGEESRLTFTIITTQANALVAELHPKQRMPVILAQEDYESWLEVGDKESARLLAPYPAEAMQALPIAARVGSPKCDSTDSSLITPVGPPYGESGEAPKELEREPSLFG